MNKYSTMKYFEVLRTTYYYKYSTMKYFEVLRTTYYY